MGSCPECNVVEVSEMVLASNSHYPQSFIQGFESREDIYIRQGSLLYVVFEYSAIILSEICNLMLISKRRNISKVLESLILVEIDFVGENLCK